MTDDLKELKDHITILDDEAAPGDAKMVSSDAIVAAGKTAISLLIDRLQQPDDPLFLEQLRVPTGPMHAGPPAVVPVRVKYHVETLLYRIVYPSGTIADDGAAPATGDSPADLISRDVLDQERPPLAFIDNWPAWWQTHQGESLDEIQSWSQGAIDQLWEKVHAETTPPPP